MDNNLLVLVYLLQCACLTRQFCIGNINAHTSSEPIENHFGGKVHIESSRLLAWKHFSGIYPPPGFA